MLSLFVGVGELFQLVSGVLFLGDTVHFAYVYVFVFVCRCVNAYVKPYDCECD